MSSLVDWANYTYSQASILKEKYKWTILGMGKEAGTELMTISVIFWDFFFFFENRKGFC